MLYVHGRQINLSDIDCSYDKHLFIDIDKGDLSELNTLAPTITYIITNRHLSDLDDFISRGYFNITTVTSASQITKNLIKSFLSQDYEDNQLKTISIRLAETYTAHGATVNDLQTALKALRDDDAVTFADIMSKSLTDILAAMSDIDAMVAYSKSLSSSKTNISQLMSDSKMLERFAEERDKYQTLYETEKANYAALGTEYSEAQETISDLRQACAQKIVTDDQVRNSKLFIDLQAQYDAAVSERQVKTQELEKLRSEMEEQIKLLTTSQKDEIIRRLKDELTKAQSMSYDKLLEGKLPVLRDSTTLDAEHVLYFKELRPTVYINSLIRWMNAYLRTRYEGMQHKQFIILVLDPLIDQNTVDKYTKHGWSINIAPATDNRIVITNIFDYIKLKQEFALNKYNLVVVIDRCHLRKNAVAMKRAQSYYFINTPNDINDYNLEPCECIGFFSSIAASKTVRDSKYHIDPWSDELIAETIDKRSGKFTSDAVFSKIFNSLGIGGEG